MDGNVKKENKGIKDGGIGTAGTGLAGDRFGMKTAWDIQQDVTVQKDFLIDGIISPGLNLFAGPKKRGKSWLALYCSLCVAGSEDFWGRKTKHGKVLYFALEDNDARMQERINIVLQYDDAPKDLHIAYSTSFLGDRFNQALDQMLAENEGIKLVVIDVLEKIRPGNDSRQSEYSNDYKFVGGLKKVADKYGISFLVVTHTRKTEDKSDRLNEITGGVGVTSAADTLLMLDRKRQPENESTIYITGRDFQQQELAVSFDNNSCRWNYISTKGELDAKKDRERYASSPIIRTVKVLLEQNGGQWSGTSTELLRHGKEITGEAIAKSEPALSRQVNSFDSLLAMDSIRHIKPNPNGGPAGRRHQFIAEPETAAAPAGDEEPSA